MIESWVGPRAGLDMMEKRKIPNAGGIRNRSNRNCNEQYNEMSQIIPDKVCPSS
jgi:hypothetical protein